MENVIKAFVDINGKSCNFNVKELGTTKILKYISWFDMPIHRLLSNLAVVLHTFWKNDFEHCKVPAEAITYLQRCLRTSISPPKSFYRIKIIWRNKYRFKTTTSSLHHYLKRKPSNYIFSLQNSIEQFNRRQDCDIILYRFNSRHLQLKFSEYFACLLTLKLINYK